MGNDYTPGFRRSRLTWTRGEPDAGRLARPVRRAERGNGPSKDAYRASLRPYYNRLEGRFTILVANAQHIKAMPGRKTDVKDCEWIADLLQHGLLTPSFIPSQAQRELRDLTRTRTTLIDERSRVVLRLQKVLEDANIKLAGVASDIMGVSARAMLEALVAGTTDPSLLAELAKGRLREKREQLERALAGRVTEHHRLMMSSHLTHIDFLDEQIKLLNQAITERLRPFEVELTRLETIPGIGRRTAEVLAAEIGLDMSHFPWVVCGADSRPAMRSSLGNSDSEGGCRGSCNAIRTRHPTVQRPLTPVSGTVA